MRSRKFLMGVANFFHITFVSGLDGDYAKNSILNSIFSLTVCRRGIFEKLGIFDKNS